MRHLIVALFFLSRFYIVQMNQYESLPVEHTLEELQDIQAVEEEHSLPCSGRKGPSAGTAAAGTAAAVASAAAEAAAEDMLLLLLAAAVQ